MASSRLPGKVLADVEGTPMLGRVIARAAKSRLLDYVSVATSTEPQDNSVACFCESINVPCFRGNEADVLDRFYRGAIHFEARVIVRLTADCPLIDPAVIDKVIQVFRSGQYDYVSNTLRPTYPDGLDTEVVGREALEVAWRHAEMPSEREHVTPYIWKRPERFRLANVTHEVDLSGLRWTVDEARDLDFVREVYAEFRSTPHFGLSDIADLVSRRPELQAINASLDRNEGYKKSVQNEAGGMGK
jgi:spore coat polysaccharide biosynthesis protein SpsF